MPGEMIDTKPIWKSKTAYLAIVAAIAPFVPGVDSFIETNPMIYNSVVAVLIFAVRLITKGRVVIS